MAAAVASRSDSKRKYSWWWDSHISPKNSKWLQENLTDMDAKVKQMIKLIEEDADSFARRAEMYYKKRPELMKMVEEFYRAYRALAERYDHATGVIRQAHRTMSENQIVFMMGDDMPAGPVDGEPQTPEMPSTRAPLDPEELPKDALGTSPSPHAIKRNGAFTEEPDTASSRKGLKQLNDLFGFTEGSARKGLDFHDAEAKDQNFQDMNEDDRMGKAEMEILTLKNALAKLEAEKEAGLRQYQQSLERLSNLESEVSHAKDDSQGLSERASKAEAEVQTLKEALTKLEAERESSFLQYQQCLEKIAKLEFYISHAEKDAAEEAESLKLELAKMETEKADALLHYKQCLEKIAALENKLLHAEDDAMMFKERAEIEGLRIKLEEMEKERQSSLHEIKELHSNLDAQKRKNASLVRSSKSQLDKMERKIHFLQEEGHRLKKKHEEEQLTKEFSSQMEVFILQQCVQDLEENNFSVLLEFQKLLEASQLSEKLISELEQENLEQQIEMRSLYDQIKVLRMGLFRLLKTVDGDSNQWYQGKSQQDQMLLNLTFVKLQAIQKMLLEIQDEKQQLLVENSVFITLIGQLQLELETLLTAKDSLHQESASRSEQYLVLQTENRKLSEMNEVLSLKIMEGERREEGLKVEMKNMEGELLALQSENRKLTEMNEVLSLKIREGDHKEEVLKVELKNLQGELLDTQSSSRKLSEMNEVLSLQIREGEHKEEVLKVELKNLQGELLALQSENRKLSEINEVLSLKIGEGDYKEEALKVELKNLQGDLLALQSENIKLLEMNEVLSLKITEGDHKEEVLKIEVKNLQGELLDLQSDRRKLSEVNEVLSLKIRDEEHIEEALKVELKNLQGELLALQTENRKLSEMNEVMSLKIVEGERREEGLKVELKNLQGELLALQSDSRKFSELNEVVSLKTREWDHKEEALKVELKNLQGELLALQNENRKLSEMNEVLSLKIGEGDYKEEALKVELKNLQGELLDLQSDGRKLSEMNEMLSLKIREGDHREEVLKGELKNLQGELLDYRRKLPEMNEVLSLKIREGDHKEEALKVELKNLQGELSDLQSSSKKLSEINEVLSLKIVEGERREESLKVELKNIKEELLALQSESGKLSEMNEVLSLKITEGDHKEEALKVELKNLQGELSDLQGSYKTLQEEARKMLEEEIRLKNFISELREEKSNLEEENCANFAEQASLGILSLILRDIISANYMEIKELRKSHEKLCLVNDNLNLELKLMEEKVMELSVIQDEKSKLHKTVGHLKSKYDEVERKEADQEQKMMKLSSDYDEQSKVLECIREENLKLKSELQLLNEELFEARSREEILNREILKGRDDIEHWESRAAALYGDLLIYAVNQALFEGKIHELIEAFKDLEGRNSLKDLEIEKLEERIRPLESENEELKARMMSYVPAFISLSDSITSLENHTLSHGALHEVDKETKDDKFARHTERFQKVGKEQGAKGAGANSDFQTLEVRIRAIEEAVMERDRAFVLEISNANSKLGAAIGQLEELKSKSANEVMTKDIILDQVSESPSYGISQRENAEADNQMLEIWETAENGSSIDITAAPNETNHRAYPSGESMLEKEVSIDKLEISRRMSGSRQEVAERLDSDAQKLINLQITVQGLKKKVEITERNQKGNAIEFNSAKEQLEESEETIAKLSEANRKLKQSIQDESFFSDESGSVRRRKISEEAKQGSEKIGKLQMEVQKLQFLLMKLDDDNKSRGETKIVERRSARVLLRDYLYGGTRNGKKKRCLCACVQPSTKGD